MINLYVRFFVVRCKGRLPPAFAPLFLAAKNPRLLPVLCRLLSKTLCHFHRLCLLYAVAFFVVTVQLFSKAIFDCWLVIPSISTVWLEKLLKPGSCAAIAAASPCRSNRSWFFSCLRSCACSILFV